MNTRTPKVRDTYRAEVWLNAAQVSFLDSLYPDQELAIQVGLLVRDEMRTSRRKTPPKPDPIASQGTVVALRPTKRPAMMRPTTTGASSPSDLPKAPSGAPAASPKAATPPKRGTESSQPLQPVPPSPSSSQSPAPAQPAPAPAPTSAAAKLQERPFLGKIHTDNPISQLQEICHKHQVRLPQYAFGHCEEGFSCECRVKVLGKTLATTGSAPNKKSAKRAAAIEVLKELGYS